MKRILLVSPEGGPEEAFPLGLAYLVAPLREAGFEPVGVDIAFGGLAHALNELACGRIQAAGISVPSHRAAECAAIVARLKALQPALPVVIGGAHPTLFPEAALRDCGADMAVRGDGEGLIVPALEALLGHGPTPQGCARRIGDRAEIIGPPACIPDLDSLAWPDRDFLPLLRYGYAYLSRSVPFAAMISSRGCSFACAHCSSKSLRTGGFRARAAGDVVEEMLRLARDYGVRSIHFEDDAILEDAGRIAELCKLLRKTRGQLKWEIINGVRPQLVTSDILADIASAGCEGLCLGIEGIFEGGPSPHPAFQPFPRVRDVVLKGRRAGLRMVGYFIVGLPGSSAEDNRKSVALSRKLGLHMAHYSPYVEIPGSRYHQEGMRSALSGKERERMAFTAMRRFYADVRVTARLLATTPIRARVLLRLPHKALLKLSACAAGAGREEEKE